MAEKNTNILQNSLKNSVFKDTGSAIDLIFEGNSRENTQNEEKSGGNTQNQLNSVENEALLEENNQKAGENAQIAAKSSTNAEETAINEANSTENPAFTRIAEENQGQKGQNNTNLFDSANVNAFSRDFPEVDVKSLQSSQEFKSFLELLAKKPTLTEVYACFSEIYASARKKSENRLVQAVANASAGVGALSSSQKAENPYFTKEQVLRMSPEQIRKNYTYIRKSQEKW
ncbi:MAG: hypothetical protein J6B45_00135 [Clostridia bacterium]|nr:hypothetical protein [Clostridia bacterium]